MSWPPGFEWEPKNNTVQMVSLYQYCYVELIVRLLKLSVLEFGICI